MGFQILHDIIKFRFIFWNRFDPDIFKHGMDLFRDLDTVTRITVIVDRLQKLCNGRVFLKHLGIVGKCSGIEPA